MTQKYYLDSLDEHAYKKAHNVQNLWDHPAQSRYLNHIEVIWAIVKQRLRRRNLDFKEDKRSSVRELDKITQEQI